jgi:hypothetical protein
MNSGQKALNHRNHRQVYRLLCEPMPVDSELDQRCKHLGTILAFAPTTTTERMRIKRDFYPAIRRLLEADGVEVQFVSRACQLSQSHDHRDEPQRRDRWFEIFHLSHHNIRFDTWLFWLNSRFMATKARIGIIGDYNPDNPTH